MDYAFRNKDIKNSIEKIIHELKSNLERKKALIKSLNLIEDARDAVINEYYFKGWYDTQYRATKVLWLSNPSKPKPTEKEIKWPQ